MRMHISTYTHGSAQYVTHDIYTDARCEYMYVQGCTRTHANAFTHEPVHTHTHTHTHIHTHMVQTLLDDRCPSQLKIASRNGCTMHYNDLVKLCKALEKSSGVVRLDLAAAIVGVCHSHAVLLLHTVMQQSRCVAHRDATVTLCCTP
jgi:hypothetical protein